MKMTDPLTRWQRYFIVVMCVILIVACYAIPPRPTTLRGWIKDSMPILGGAVAGGLVARRQAADRRSEAKP